MTDFIGAVGIACIIASTLRIRRMVLAGVPFPSYRRARNRWASRQRSGEPIAKNRVYPTEQERFEAVWGKVL